MTSYQDCINTVQAAARAAGKELSEDEVGDIFQSLQLRQAYLKSIGQDLNPAAYAMQAAEQLAQDYKAAALNEKRSAAINLKLRMQHVAWVQKHFGNNIAEGLEAILVGVNRAKPGARLGVAQLQESLLKKYLSGFEHDIESAGLSKILAKGSLDDEVAQAMWAMDKDKSLLDKLPKDAVKLAKITKKWGEISRLDANEAGANIGKYDGYITRVSHDPERIKGDGSSAAFERWKDKALKTFDIGRMLEETGNNSAQEMLHGIWMNLATGDHTKAVPKGELSGFKGPGNLAKKLSQSKVIHFKDGMGWADYNKEFGSRNLRESIFAGLRNSADKVGLMQKLGTNPESMFDTLKSDLLKITKEQGKTDNEKLIQASELQDKYVKLDKFMQVVDGSANIPGNALWARRMSNIRVWKMMSSLGSMIFSQLNDLAVYGAGVRHQGGSFFSGMGEAINGLGRSLKPAERKELLASLGIAIDNMAGEMGRIGSFQQPGLMSWAPRAFMKMNLGEWWVSHMRASAALGTSHRLALNAGKEFAELHPDLQRTLSTYNIDSTAWDHIRTSSAEHLDGNHYVVPEHVQDKASSELLRHYLSDQTYYLALEPDKKTQAYMLRGLRPGTVEGEAARFLMQFKSFTGAYMQKILGRELYGRGYEGDSLIGVLKNGNGEFQGLAQLIAMSTLMGYASMQLKALAKGQTVQQPESMGDAAQQFLASAVQGGGAGIYGDFIFGQASRMGGGTMETLAGPVLSEGGRIVDLYHTAIGATMESTGQSSSERMRQVGAKAFNEAINNTPFINLFYSRMILNYAIFYRIQESMNPGYLRRQEQNAKQNDRKFIISPSEAVR